MAGSWEPLLFRVRRDGANGYRATPEQVAAWREEHSPQMIARLKALGVNFGHDALLQGRGHGGGAREYGRCRAFFGPLSRCGDAGRRVQLQRRFLWEPLFKEVPQAKDWVLRNADGTPVTYGDATYRYYWNRNHPDAEAYYLRLVHFAVHDIRTDLLHFDNYNVGPGHDRDSVAGFRRYLAEMFTAGQLAGMGAAVPGAAEPPGAGSPELLRCAWLDFCCRSLAESYRSMGRYARSLRPDVLVECNPGGVNDGIYPPVDHGRLLEGGDAYWVESGRIGYRDGRLISRIRNYKTGRAMDNMTFDYTLTPLEMAESMAFNLDCLGCICWFEYGNIVAMPGAKEPVSDRLAPYIRFFHRRRDLFRGASVAADVAVLRSFPSQAFGGRKYAALTARAEDLLIENRACFQIIYDGRLNDLRPDRALVLAGCVAMGDPQIDQIRRFVARGGRLAVIGPLATHDPWMMPRPKPALDDLPASAVIRAAGNEDCLAAIRRACGGELSLETAAAAGPGNPASPAQQASSLTGLATELTQQAGRRLVHLVNYRSDQPIRNVAVTVHLADGSHPRSVRLAGPDHENDLPLPFKQDGSAVRFIVPEIATYEIAVVQ